MRNSTRKQIRKIQTNLRDENINKWNKTTIENNIRLVQAEKAIFELEGKLFEIDH
jgi:hypothetical protein